MFDLSSHEQIGIFFKGTQAVRDYKSKIRSPRNSALCVGSCNFPPHAVSVMVVCGLSSEASLISFWSIPLTKIGISHLRLCQVLFGIFIEGPLTTGCAEIIRLPFVFRFARGGFGSTSISQTGSLKVIVMVTSLKCDQTFSWVIDLGEQCLDLCLISG